MNHAPGAGSITRPVHYHCATKHGLLSMDYTIRLNHATETAWVSRENAVLHHDSALTTHYWAGDNMG